MPAKSQAQRGYLAVNKGPAWMKKHGFDNKGKLPKYVKGSKAKKAKSKKAKRKKR